MASSQSKPSDQSNESNSKMNSSNNSSSQSPNLPSAIDNSSQSVSTESSHQEINKTQIPDDSSVEKRFGSLEMKELRTLIDHPMVGAVIGKGGANVKRVREETGCFVSILKTDQRIVSERIMCLKGTASEIQEAAGMIGQLLLSSDNPQIVPKEAGSTQLRVLVHKNHVGCIIGKGGVVIRQTQEDTGARIQISSEPLPGSTEKVCAISGTPEQIKHALTVIMKQMADNPLKETVKHYPYNPAAQYQMPMGYRAYGLPPNIAATVATRPIPFTTLQHLANQGPQSTQKIAIPTICAGCVIGRHGSVIKDLRVRSGAVISIADPTPDSPEERIVTLTGSAYSIQTAVYLIRQLVEQYTPREPINNSS